MQVHYGRHSKEHSSSAGGEAYQINNKNKKLNYNMARLFGFSVDDKQKQPPSVVSPVPQNNEDGNDYYILVVFMVNTLTLKVFIKQNLT